VLTAARGIVLVVAVLVVWRLRHVADSVVRVGTSYLVLLTAMYLASSLSETYYSMTLLPALLLVARRAGSPLRQGRTWRYDALRASCSQAVTPPLKGHLFDGPGSAQTAGRP